MAETPPATPASPASQPASNTPSDDQRKLIKDLVKEGIGEYFAELESTRNNDPEPKKSGGFLGALGLDF